MGDGYDLPWDCYKKRNQYQDKIGHFLGEYFTNKFPSKPAQEIKSMLSVGHGEGDIDVPLLSGCLTGVTRYHGVDTRQSAIDAMGKRLSAITGRTLLTDFTADYIQKYEGPANPVDFILVGHVMNYVVQEFQSVIDKTKTWLSPGGCLVLSHLNPNTFFLKAEDIVGGRGLQHKRFAEEKERCKERLKKEGWTVEDHLIDHQHDFSGTSSEVEFSLNILTAPNLTTEEFQQLDELIESESVKGTRKVPYTYEISIVYK